MLKSNKRLVSQTPIRPSTGLKKSKLKKAPKHPISRLKKRADTLYSWYVRLRDCELVDGAWQGQCITCDKVLLVRDANGKWKHTANIGHFITRGDFSLRYDEENCNLQCAHCNAWRDKSSMLDAYELALDDKYGDGTATKLKAVHKSSARTTLTRPEFDQVIADATEYIKVYENLLAPQNDNVSMDTVT